MHQMKLEFLGITGIDKETTAASASKDNNDDEKLEKNGIGTVFEKRVLHTISTIR